MSDRGVSDVLGFILVFSIITLSIGLVSLTGFTGLEERQNAEQTRNAERAFEILADNVEDIYRRGAPRRSTEIALAGARLSSAEPTKVEAIVTNREGTPSNAKVSAPIRYTAPDGTALVYENGAVIREEPSGAAVMIHEPPLFFDEDDGEKTAMLPIISTSAATAIGGETTTLVRTESTGPSPTVLDRYTADSATRYVVQLQITTAPERAIVWRRYLDKAIDRGYGTTDACEAAPSVDRVAKITCTFSTDRLTVVSTRIDVEFA